MAKKIKYYVVWQGWEPGVYSTWKEAEAQIHEFSGARYKSFLTKEEADAAYVAGAPAISYARSAAKKESVVPPTEHPLTRSIAVDAACAGNPGKMEYRGISLWDNKEIFHMQFALGTNNIGEFLAIVHGLAMLKQHNSEDITIYSDSQTAIGWVKRKHCNTKLEQTPRTAELLSLVRRAEKWLSENVVKNPIVKWPTEVWGEIPADFGRK